MARKPKDPVTAALDRIGFVVICGTLLAVALIAAALGIAWLVQHA